MLSIKLQRTPSPLYPSESIRRETQSKHMKIIDLTLDERINGYCATIACTYEWYLTATTGAEANLNIQRGIIKDSKAYQTLRADLRRGCVLPPLVLAISGITFPANLSREALENSAVSHPIITDLQTQLNIPRPADTYIIDGLQRTNALRQTREDLGAVVEERARFLARPLRVEIWLNIPFGAVAYRMLLLNAGQKPMSMKHQVEILSMKLAEDLRSIPGLEILMSLSAQRRVHAGQFTLAKLSQSFQAWLQGTPNIDVRNTVMEQLLAEEAIETLGTSLSGANADDDFKALVTWMIEMDQAIWPTEPQFFGNETVLLGLSAAVGRAQRSDQLRERMKKSLTSLKTAAMAGNTNVLAVQRFNDLRRGEDVRKVNVGQFTRDMVYRAFQEFFMSDGTKTMEDCWAFGAAQS